MLLFVIYNIIGVAAILTRGRARREAHGFPSSIGRPINRKERPQNRLLFPSPNRKPNIRPTFHLVLLRRCSRLLPRLVLGFLFSSEIRRLYLPPQPHGIHGMARSQAELCLRSQDAPESVSPLPSLGKLDGFQTLQVGDSGTPNSGPKVII